MSITAVKHFSVDNLPKKFRTAGYPNHSNCTRVDSAYHVFFKGSHLPLSIAPTRTLRVKANTKSCLMKVF